MKKFWKTGDTVTPKEMRREIHGVTGVRYDIGTIRRRLHSPGMSAKTLQAARVRKPNVPGGCAAGSAVQKRLFHA